MSRPLDRAAELREAFDRGFAEAPPEAPGVEVDLLAIRVAGQPYAVRVLDLRELAPCRRVTAVPAGAPALLGLVGVRGEIVPVFALAELLGHAAAAAPPAWMIVCGGDERIGLAFDELERHLRLPADALHGGRAVRLDGAVRPLIDALGLATSLLRKDR